MAPKIRFDRLRWLLPLLAPCKLFSQPHTRPADSLLTVERYLDYETVASPRVSPDGSQVIYTRWSIDRMKDVWQSSLWIMGPDGTRNRFLAKGSSPVWSPDGTRIAYLAEGGGESGELQVFVQWMDAEGAVSQVTRVSETPGDLKWSPDGKWIGFSMLVPTGPAWRVTLPSPPPGATWTPPPRLVERLHHRADRRGFLQPGYLHLFLVSAGGGTPRDLTPGEWSVGQAASGGGVGPPVGWDWLPGGKTIVVEGNDDPDRDRVYRVCHLYLVDVETGARRRLTQTPGFWTNPSVSPDGKLIAFTGFPATRQTYRAADLYTITPDGKTIALKTPGFDRTPADPSWAPDNGGIYFVAEDRGTMNLHFAPVKGGVRQLTTGTHVVSSPTISRKGTGFAIRSNYHRPPDLVRINLKKPSEMVQLTEVNADLLGGTQLGEVEEIWYRSGGGARIQGWIVKPPSFDPARRYPMILFIHGGPHDMYTAGFDYRWQSLAANGFVVLYTNPRGSSGYGSDFGNAVDRAWPGVDYDDLMAGVDSLLGRGYVDPQAQFVAGCSGGGVLSSWIIGHTDRFSAAVVMCPVTDWISEVGTTDVPLPGYNFFEKPFWEDPAPWLKQSPLMYVGQVKTPTLLMTGVLDLRTPIAQAEEYFAALKLRGVPTALLRFEGEWHTTTSRPSNWMRTLVYSMEWFRRWADGRTGG